MEASSGSTLNADAIFDSPAKKSALKNMAIRACANASNQFIASFNDNSAIRRHPEILDEDVSDPIIIIGLPRSGTTKLQRMMAAAPDVQKLLMWRMLNPARFPDAIPGPPRSAHGRSRIAVSL